MKNKNRRINLNIIRRAVIASFIIFAGAAVLFSIFFSYNPLPLISAYLRSDANSFIFAVLMALLPLFGAPISIFLVLVGMKYGITEGILVTGAVILFHLLVTYYLVHSFFRSMVIRMLQRFNLTIPHLPRRGKKRIGFFFMIFPGIPYTVKNYVFALTGMPFRPYMAISWPAQFGLSIPFIILGKGIIHMDPVILSSAIIILLLSILGQYYIRRKYKNSDTRK